MEEKRLNRRNFLKYAGVGSLAALTILGGRTRTAQASVGDLLGFIGEVPENIWRELPRVIGEINSDPERHLGSFMSDPRGYLDEFFDIKLDYTKIQLIAFDLSPEETPWPKVIADPQYPYEAEITISPPTVGFTEGRVGLVLRPRVG